MPTPTIIEQRKQIWSDFYEQSGPQVLYLIRNEQGAEPAPDPFPENRTARIDWALWQYERQLDQITWLDDHTLPHLYCRTGTEIFAEAFGCPVVRRAGDMPFALPCVDNLTDAEALVKPSLWDSPLASLFDLADEVQKRAGPEALMRMLDVQSPIDIAALIWEKTDFYVAMLEHPAAVRRLTGKIYQLLTDFLDAWLTRYGRTHIAHWPDYYVPCGVTLSEDEVGVVNGQMFLDLYLPELLELSKRYGGIGVHCCANSKHQWENFKQIKGLFMLNLVRPQDQAQEALSVFAAHCAQHPHGLDAEVEPWDQVRMLPANARVVLEVTAEDPEDAKRKSEKMRDAIEQLTASV